MKFSELDPEEQQNLQMYDAFVRGVLSTFMDLMKNADATVWTQFSKTDVEPALHKLGDRDEIPRISGHAGAQDLTKLELQALQNIVRSVVGTSQQNFALIVKAIGVNTGGG